MQRRPSPSVVPGRELPWWVGEAGLTDTEAAPVLEGRVEADVAVVGGGYAGLWTALGLLDRDPALRVAVVEAGARCGMGPSGRNGGFLHGYWSSLATLRAVLGDARALELARAGDRIVPAVRRFCEERGEDVWLRESGLLKVSAAPAQDAAVERAVAAARDLGMRDEAVPLDREEVAARCASPRFRRGVLFRDGATVQPARLDLALRRAVLDRGVALFEGSPVLRVRAADPNELETPRGILRARDVVLAVNAALTGWGPAARRLTNFGSYVVLTEPVPDLLRALGWTGGEAIVDGRMFLHYFRTTADGRVVMGSGSGPIGHGGRVDGRFLADVATAGRAEAGLRRLLPGLAGARVTHTWGGPIDVSADRLPFVETLPGRRLHYAAGFSGNGVGPSWLAAQALASLAVRTDDEWTRMPLVGRAARLLPPEPLKRIGGGWVRRAALAVEDAEQEERRPLLLAQAVAALPRVLGVRIGVR